MKESSGFAAERPMGLMGSATLPTGESSGLIGENRSSHHLNKLLLGGFIIDGPVGLTGTLVLVGLIRGPLVVVGACDGARVEDTKSLTSDGFAVKTVKVLGFNGGLVDRIGFSVVECVCGCLLVRFTKGLRVVEWAWGFLVGRLKPTTDLRVVESMIGLMGWWVARFTNGFSVAGWMFGCPGCLVGRFANGFSVVEWMFDWSGCLVCRFTNGFRLVDGR